MKDENIKVGEALFSLKQTPSTEDSSSQTINEPLEIGETTYEKALVTHDIPKRSSLDTGRTTIQLTGDENQEISLEGTVDSNLQVSNIDDLRNRLESGTPITLNIQGKKSDWKISSLTTTYEGGTNYKTYSIDLIRMT